MTMTRTEHSPKELERIRRYRLIDDTFLSVVFQDKECTQLLIRCVLQREDLTVIQVRTQRELKNLWGRSVRLDVLAADEAGNLYNIEVQRSDSGAARRRARYNSSLLDAHVTEPGDEYEALAESFVIFITENDYFRQGLPMYHIERVVQETGELFADGEHIIYVNGQYRGPDPVGELMHDFFCQDPAEMSFPLLARNVRYYKDDAEGVDYMCRISEEIWEEGREKGRQEGQKEGRRVGRQEGEQQMLVQNIRRLMENTSYTFLGACDVLGVPQENRAGLERLLGS